MNLNERAARIEGWTHIGGTPDCMVGLPPNGMNYEPLNDYKNDYNHARMLYARVVEKGLEEELGRVVLRHDDGTTSVMVAMLNLTPAQLTEACCEVLEQNGGKE